MAKTKNSSKEDKGTTRRARGQAASKPLGDSATAASSKNKAKRKVGGGPVVPVLGVRVGDGVVVPTNVVGNGPVVPTLQKSDETEKDDHFKPHPIILPLRKIQQMINAGSIKLVVSPQNRLAAKQFKGLSQELSKYGLDIGLKSKEG